MNTIKIIHHRNQPLSHILSLSVNHGNTKISPLSFAVSKKAPETKQSNVTFK